MLAGSREDANTRTGTKPVHKFPFKVMVWCGLTYQGATKVIVLPPKTSFDSNFYIKNVLPIVEKEGPRLIGNDFVFQQDGATCHKSGESITYIKNSGMKFISPRHWPANSPDLNVLDYFFWNEVSSRLTVKKFTARDDLIKKIKETVKEIPLKMIQDAINQFRSRVYAVQINQGGLILNKYF